MIEERKEQLKNEDESIRMIHEDRPDEFFNEIEQAKSRNTAVLKFKTVKSFYKANHYELKNLTPRTWATFTDKVPSLDEVHKMVEASDSPVQKAIILFSAQSGQRVGILTAITYGMVREALESSESPVSVHVSGDLRDRNGNRINKNRQEYTFFVGRDTIKALKLYVEYMENKGHVFNDESPLFVTDKKYGYRKFGGKKVTGEKVYRPVDASGINTHIQRASIRAGIIPKSVQKTASGNNKYAIYHHCFRKFWQTAMEQAGIAKPWYEYMMGHSLGQLDRAYSRPTVEQLQEAYRRAENYLSVSRANMTDLDNIKKDLLLSVIQQQCQIIGFDCQRIVIAEEKDRGMKLTIDEGIEVLQKEIMDVTLGNKINNNKHKHKIVTEGELTGYLDEGWDLLQDLSSGKFVVKNPMPNGVKSE